MAPLTERPVVVLAGGVGAARFLRGLVQVVPPAELVVIGNTGDDIWMHGLHVSPDLDTVLYWLAGVGDEQRGWGIRGDTFTMQRALERFLPDAWFQLGDQDLAVNLYRTARLRSGVPLHAVTRELSERHRVKATLLPMSDDPVTTRVVTEVGDLHFQEYFVREKCAPAVSRVYWTGLDNAVPAPGVADAIGQARAILVAPSNPVISIGPILRVRGVRDMLAGTRDRTVAISPLIGGAAIKGPTVALMRAQGLEPSALSVATLYRDFATGFVIDPIDAELQSEIETLGYRVAVTPSLLHDPAVARTVAETALRLAEPALAA